MRIQIENILYRISVDVLEKIAFIFSFPDKNRDRINTRDAIISCVSFKGVFDGNLVMTVSTPILAELTGNMLGLDDGEETSWEQHHDAVKELINVICGNLLPAIAGKQTIFHVETPKILENNHPLITASDSEPVAVAKLRIEEEGRCDVQLFIDGRIPKLSADSENEK